MKCMHCRSKINTKFVDLGEMPPANAYSKTNYEAKMEKSFPLRIWVCENCWLVQCEQFHLSNDLFKPDYAYFSGVSTSWLKHAEKFVEEIVKDLVLGADSTVCEIASNDGYLLKNFIKTNISFYGIEPTKSTAKVSKELGIETIEDFFTNDLAKKLVLSGRQCDLIIANNVLAHVPDINNFAKGLKSLLKPAGTITIEFQSLVSILSEMQFDTLYHEHFSYLSLTSVTNILKSVGLRPFHVIKIPTHGGSLRIYCCHESDSRSNNSSINEILKEELAIGLKNINSYRLFQDKIEKIKTELILYLKNQKKLGKTIVGYGAAAKANTLLNFAGISTDLISAVFDAAESKQHKFMPGSGIPILSPLDLYRYKADGILIFPWNIKDEICMNLRKMISTDIKLFTAIPEILFHE